MDVTMATTEPGQSNAPFKTYHDTPEGTEADSVRIRIQFYMMAVIIPVGLFFNTLAFCIFLRSRTLRSYTRTHFLIALTIADSLYLIGELLIWLNTSDPHYGQIFSTEFIHTSRLWCSVAYFLRYFGQFASSWLIVAISLERLLSMIYPIKMTQLRNQIMTSSVIAVIFFVSAGFNVYPFWTLDITDYNSFTMCVALNEHTIEVWTWIMIRIGSLLIPGMLVFLFTGMIIWKLRSLRVTSSPRNHFTLASQNTTAIGHNLRMRTNVEKQHIAMLIIVAIFFLLLRLPYIIMYYVFTFREEFFGPDIDFWFEHRLWVANDVTYAIAASNYAVNFFLYCLSSSLFRQRLCCRKEESEGMETFISDTDGESNDEL